MGSVKDIVDLPEGAVLPKQYDPSKGYKACDTSDRFSVFDLKDYLKDRIPLKGLSLCMMAAHDFEFLESQGVRTHYVGLLDEDNRVVRTAGLVKPSNRLVFRAYDFHDDNVVFQEDSGTYDYSFFEQNRGRLDEYVVLIEFVFRNGAPEGSSLFRKTIPKWQADGDTAKIEGFLRRTGLSELPKPGDMFQNPIYDFWTKAEKEDRRVGDDSDYEEAVRVSGLTKFQFRQVTETLVKVSTASAGYLKSVGIDLYDGKREFAWDSGPVLVDFPATLDEDRWLRNGRQISKEFLRLYMEKTFPEFYKHMNECKKRAEEEGVRDFRQLLQMEVPRYPQEILDLASKLYAAAADVVLQRPMFHEVYGTPKLDDLLEEVDKVEAQLKAKE